MQPAKIKKDNLAAKGIIASGYLAPSPTEAAAFAGVKRFVNKPSILTKWLEVVRDVLRNE